MTFFDRKEEVIDLKLTQHGKYLLSKGKFKPVYYAFFDDDIIYDYRYVQTGSANPDELQNDTELRIKEQTPRMHTQYVFRGIETDVKKQIRDLRDSDEYKEVVQLLAMNEENLLIRANNEQTALKTVALQPTEDKHYAMGSPLGSSDLNKSDIPAWFVKFHNGEMSGSSYFVTSSAAPTEKIPQLDCDITYKIRIFENEEAAEEFTDDPAVAESGTEAENDHRMQLGDGTVIQVESDFILVEVNEENGIFELENFDIEVYQIENVTPGKSGPVLEQEKLIPLYFSTGYNTANGEEVLDLGPNYVESQFDLMTDDEIDPDVIDGYVGISKPKNKFTDTSAEKTKKILGKYTKDMYATDITDEDLGDPC